MMHSPIPLARLSQAQRVALVAMTLIPVLCVTAALLPALVVLPFFPRGFRRVCTLIGKLQAWTQDLLAGTREGRLSDCHGREPGR